jgi:hypothetical protein
MGEDTHRHSRIDFTFSHIVANMSLSAARPFILFDAFGD